MIDWSDKPGWTPPHCSSRQSQRFSVCAQHRLKLAEELGMDHVINPKEEEPVEFVKKRTGGKGADSVVCSIAHPVVIASYQMFPSEGESDIPIKPGSTNSG